MMNYMKSEFYRLSRLKIVYGFTLTFIMLSLLMNGILGWYYHSDVNFLYGTTSFVYSILVGNPMLFVALAILVTITLYDGNHRNGNLKNTVSFGISRVKIFVGMSLVTTIIATCVMVIILSVYLLSANMWLAHRGPVQLNDLWTEIIAIYLMLVATIVTTLFFLAFFPKGGLATFLSFMVWMIIPNGLYHMTLKIDWLHQLTLLLPNNLFANMQVNMSQSVTVWGTSEGMLKCIIIGLIHLVSMYLVSFIFLRKRDI